MCHLLGVIRLFGVFRPIGRSKVFSGHSALSFGIGAERSFYLEIDTAYCHNIVYMRCVTKNGLLTHHLQPTQCVKFLLLNFQFVVHYFDACIEFVQ